MVSRRDFFNSMVGAAAVIRKAKKLVWQPVFFDNCVSERVQPPPPEVDREKAQSPCGRLALNRVKRD